MFFIRNHPNISKKITVRYNQTNLSVAEWFRALYCLCETMHSFVRCPIQTGGEGFSVYLT